MKIVLPERSRPFVADHLPHVVDPVFTSTLEQALRAVPGAEIGWFDMLPVSSTAAAIVAGTELKWVATSFAGLDGFPFEVMRERGIVLTNGVGVNAIPCAEYVVLGMLAAAKNFPEVVRGQDRREWLMRAPGVGELYDSRALIIGYGHIGREVAQRLRAFGVRITAVRRSATTDPDVIGPDQWRARLAEFDWVVLAAPATEDTRHMIGAAELQRMKAGAWIVNIARGTLIDQDALVAAVRSGRIGGAFLDVTDPEPLPQDHPLWSTPNIIMTMHLSSRSQTRMAERSSALFLDNLHRYLAGEPLRNRVDLSRGY